MAEFGTISLPSSSFGDDASKVKEFNTNMSFVWMKNPGGRLVPIGLHRIEWCLNNRYTHTDSKVITEDPKDNVRENMAPVETDPLKALAKLMEKVVDHQIGAQVTSEDKPEDGKKRWQFMNKEEREAYQAAKAGQTSISEAPVLSTNAENVLQTEEV